MSRKAHLGLSLIELMVSLTISLAVLAALVSVFAGVSRGNRETVKTNSLIDSGRFAMQLLEEDLTHAGFWDGYFPQFDDFTEMVAPSDVPTAIPNPCTPNANWDLAYMVNFVGINVQATDVLPSGTGCTGLSGQVAGTDVLIVRHTDTCTAGSGNCEAATADDLYFQVSRCLHEKSWNSSFASASSVEMPAWASSVNGAYKGALLRISGGTGAGQIRRVSAYDGSTKTVTVAPNWGVTPDGTSKYSIDYKMGSGEMPLRVRDCTGAIGVKKVSSAIYFIRNLPHPSFSGESIPTLMRSQLAYAGGSLVHQEPVPLIDGVERFRVELGIDNQTNRCLPATSVNFAQAPALIDPATCAVDAVNSGDNTLPTNRGDGVPDQFVRCTTAAPCTAAQLMNVVAARVYLLVRSADRTVGYVDSKTYCMGQANADGSCPAANQVSGGSDNYKRHLFSMTIRLTNVSGRRISP